MATFMPSTCESPTGSLARAQPLQLCGLPAFGRASAHHLGEREADDDAHLSLRTDDSAEKTAVLEHKRGLVQLAAAERHRQFVVGRQRDYHNCEQLGGKLVKPRRARAQADHRCRRRPSPGRGGLSVAGRQLRSALDAREALVDALDARLDAAEPLGN
eukprot:CAMPEP_0179865562 /NCGR_PEP_ID=MMETSP0982-20121206/16909_1 /TAXON_ID=483367 /ORGANISM="non described non described, Strain CCMP 2436" /LENGTH=157 /DNA_ID=CAMNT_0021754275 /DNA_START=812 /DNA_END=1286 /DNA_ORIENTATION=-